MTQTINFDAWNKATGDLLPGQQAVFLDVLNLVSEGKAHLVWGADYRDGKPCLVNAVGQMLSTSGGHGIPMQQFGDVVSEFDRLNARMHEQGINENGYVSPLAADILIRNFGEIKPMVVTEETEVVEPVKPYVEPTDEQFMSAWLDAMKAPAPSEVAQGEPTPETEYVRAHVDFPNA